VINGSQSSSGV